MKKNAGDHPDLNKRQRLNATKHYNIYIVDDDKIFTLALKADIENVFKNVSVKVHTFETGEKCMARFIRELPEIVILDYHLDSRFPDASDGIKILDWMKTESPESYVIMLSADDNIEVATESFKHGASDYVVKTETKFKKLNYSLLNVLKILEKKKEAKRFKKIAFGFLLVIALLIIIEILIQQVKHYTR